MDPASFPKFLGEGFDNRVYQIEDLVFRFPKHELAEKRMLREIKILTWLQTKGDFPLPVPLYISEAIKEFPFFYYAHKALKGETACKLSFSEDQYKEIAGDLGKLLKKLHTLDVSELEGEGLEPLRDRTNLPEVKENLLRYLSAIKDKYSLQRYLKPLENLMAEAASYKPQEKKSLTHGDLYQRHLLFSKEKKLTGIIDWGHSCLNDPIVDLALGTFFFPREAREVFFESYGEFDRERRKFSEFLALYSASCLLYFSNRTGDIPLQRLSRGLFQKCFSSEGFSIDFC